MSDTDDSERRRRDRLSVALRLENTARTRYAITATAWDRLLGCPAVIAVAAGKGRWGADLVERRLSQRYQT